MPPDKRVPSGDGMPKYMGTTDQQIWLNRSIRADILDIGSNVAWADNMVLDSLVSRVTEHGWEVILKGHKGPRQYAAYVSGHSYADAMELAAAFALQGCLTWGQDKYPPKKKWVSKP